MKTLKLTIAVIALLFVGVTANAATAAITKSDVVNIYIDAIANGKVKGLDNVLDEQMQFCTQRGANVNTISKDKFLGYLGNGSDATAPLNTSTTIMQDDENSQKVKIDFKYDGYVRTDVVTINHTTGWVITNVTSSYQ